MIDSAEEDLKEEETRMVICQDGLTEMNENSHTILIQEARTIVFIQLTNTVTAQALGEVGLEVPGMIEEDACTQGRRIMDFTVRGLIGVCDQFHSQVLSRFFNMLVFQQSVVLPRKGEVWALKLC